MPVETNVSDVALERMVSQYDTSTTLRSLVSGIGELATTLLDSFNSIGVLRSIDDASGDALDVIGEILGQPREIANIVPITFFNLRDEADPEDPSAGFGDETDPTAGARFRSENESVDGSALLSDPEYRALLKAKIPRSRTSATPEDVISAIQIVLPDNPAVHLTIGSAVVTAEVQRPLSATEQLLLDALVGIRGEIPLIPRPVGVDLTVAGI